MTVTTINVVPCTTGDPYEEGMGDTMIIDDSDGTAEDAIDEFISTVAGGMFSEPVPPPSHYAAVQE